MKTRASESLYRPWVDRTARHIPDSLCRLRYLQAVAPRSDAPSRRVRRWQAALLSVACVFLLGSKPRVRRAAVPPLVNPGTRPAPAPAANVWTVETGLDFELFSNGLRIENRYKVENRRRSYLAFARHAEGSELRTAPAGIVYHTTESLQAPFEPSQNSVLKRVSESLADYVRRRRAYNFLIDRFGRVYRIVLEEDAANHAGHSIWADDSWIYINLNDSFLGVSFEAETASLPGAERVNPAQVRAAAMLTEMLRNRYGIPATNCVTHAQVSVNPSNYQIGYHTDWASSFPFERLGLPDNYSLPLPSVTLFGFQYGPGFLQVAGPRLAATASQSAPSAPGPLRRRYLQISAAVKVTFFAAAE